MSHYKQETKLLPLYFQCWHLAADFTHHHYAKQEFPVRKTRWILLGSRECLSFQRWEQSLVPRSSQVWRWQQYFWQLAWPIREGQLSARNQSLFLALIRARSDFVLSPSKSEEKGGLFWGSLYCVALRPVAPLAWPKCTTLDLALQESRQEKTSWCANSPFRQWQVNHTRLLL